MSVRAWAKRAVTQSSMAIGVDLIRLASPRHPIGRRARLLSTLGIDLVIDVGANQGQFGVELRRMGYRGSIMSLEPLSEPYRRLAQLAAADGHWDTVQVAAGPEQRRAVMHVAANAGASSSFFAMLDLHARNAPEATITGVETVDVMPLDGIVAGHSHEARLVFLKLDVQGYELEALAGGSETLASATLVQLELSLVPLYASAPSYREVLEYMHERAFHLVGLETGRASSTGVLLQADGLFIARDARDRLLGER